MFRTITIADVVIVVQYSVIMLAEGSNTVTSLLLQARKGDFNALDELYDRIYNELHYLAKKIRKGNSNPTLDTTALVHEAYLKMIPSMDQDWQNRSHFFCVAAKAMRQIVINYARQRNTLKRNQGQHNLELREESSAAISVSIEDMITIDSILDRLEQMDERQAKIVECRFFAGMNIEETGTALNISSATVKRDWRVARAWLIKELGMKAS
ncbi:MAG TPA: sigma-70 family RNA polymerase sigma factor [Saprospiraceae bacterium]|nr:sigma-70 family RNA polymerase sigma factor [Saprospiraceae bacterium]